MLTRILSTAAFLIAFVAIADACPLCCHDEKDPVKVTLVVNPVGDFDMTTSASTITVKRGSFFSPYAYFKTLNGFYANVYFSNSTLPCTMRWSLPERMPRARSTWSHISCLSLRLPSPPAICARTFKSNCPITWFRPLSCSWQACR